MKEYCQNKAVKEVPVSIDNSTDQVRSLCAACDESYSWGVQYGKMPYKGLKIDPPPKEKGEEPLFTVVYIIDVNATDIYEAAEYAHRIMTDPSSLRPILHILDSNGVDTVIDLSERINHG